MLQPRRARPVSKTTFRTFRARRAAIRQVLAAHFVRDCPHIVEIGGHLRPVTDYLTHAPLSVLSVDPKTRRSRPTTAWPAVPCAPCAAKVPGGRVRLCAGSYGLVLLGYSLKPSAAANRSANCSFRLIDNAKVVVIEYPPALERATSQVPSILSAAVARRCMCQLRH